METAKPPKKDSTAELVNATMKDELRALQVKLEQAEDQVKKLRKWVSFVFVE